MGTRRHRDHRNGEDGFTDFDQHALHQALAASNGIKFEYEHMHVPLSQPVCAAIQLPGVVKVIACGGLDHATQLARDLFVKHGGELAPEECLRLAREFWARTGQEMVRLQAEAAVQQAMQGQPEEQGTGGIVVP